jgi:protein involved in sex pheromone biosynthesis
MKKTIIMFLFATLILGSCNNTNNNQPNDNPSQNANNSENVDDNKKNKKAIDFDAEV